LLLNITTTHKPATDLGYLLHKNPAKLHEFELSFGHAYVLYPEANEDRCTASLILDIDPIGLVRGRKSSASVGPLAAYVNDRPYVASSFLSVAISRVFGTAISGRSKQKPELAETSLPFIAELIVLPSKGGKDLIRRLFEPLGYTVEINAYTLDEKFPEWGMSHYYTVVLSAECRLRDLLTHIYVLVPVLDEEKHYWIGDDEVDKLLKYGEGWLTTHPERKIIASRYLKRLRSLAEEALERLISENNTDIEKFEGDVSKEAMAEESINLNNQRINTVVETLKELGVKRVIDLGCGEGRLLKALLDDRGFQSIAGMDVSYRSLEKAKQRLNLEQLPPMLKDRVILFQGSLTYQDKRLQKYDAAAVIEVIEHMDAARLAAFERVLFEFARPHTIVLTTPNKEYNAKFKNLLSGQYRHPDHRFEWIREEFQTWAKNVAQRYDYSVRFQPIGEEDTELGPPTQMGVFTL
jgi:3' terminal RNA ribose 2'-O-methyltransferase Hen1